MTTITVPGRDNVSAANQAIFDQLKQTCRPSPDRTRRVVAL